LPRRPKNATKEISNIFSCAIDPVGTVFMNWIGRSNIDMTKWVATVFNDSTGWVGGAAKDANSWVSGVATDMGTFNPRNSIESRLPHVITRTRNPFTSIFSCVANPHKSIFTSVLFFNSVYLRKK
jgi:hypothetical protein